MMTLKDLVLETSTTTGTGAYNLAGPTSGFRSFSVAGNGAKVPYIVTDGTNFEIGVGTVTVGSPNTLTRTTIRDSSNSGAAVNWGVGTRMIRLAQLAPFTNSKDENLNFVDYFGTPGGAANAHTLTLAPAPIAYSNGMMIAYRATAANTTAAVSVNVNSLGAKDLKINGANPSIGQIQIGTLIVALYNLSNNTFEIINTLAGSFLPLSGGNVNGAINEKITTVASSATPDIWTGTGNVIDYTGTVTSTGFVAAPQAGARRTLVCAGISTFTNGSNMIINGGGNFTSAAGDIINVIAVTTTQFRLEPVKTDGTPIAGANKIIQDVNTTWTTISTTKAMDDTAPTSTNGSQINTKNINPSSATKNISGYVSGAITRGGGAGYCMVFVLRGATVVRSQMVYSAGPSGPTPYAFDFLDSPASAAAQTYTVRAVSDTTCYVNGNATGRLGGGTQQTTLTLQQTDP